jgi:hypothetical protein
MSFSSNGLKEILKHIEKNEGDTIFGSYPYKYNELLLDIFDLDGWNSCFMKPYNAYYGTNHDFNDIENIPLFLMHTFIIPKSFFIHMMSFVDKINNRIINGLHNNMRHYAGTMERVFALCISFGIIERKLKYVGMWDGISHNISQHSGDELRGIPTGDENNMYNN